MSDIRLIPLALSVLIVFNLAACRSSTADLSAPARECSVSVDDSNWKIAGSEPIVLQNASVLFSLNPTTTHFTVTDLQAGKQYSSVPESPVTTLSDEDTQRLNSELTITYYEKQSTAYYMYSAQDSVKCGQSKVCYSENAVRVYYTLGSPGYFVPAVFDQATFENEILGKLNSDAKVRKLSRYYTLYDRTNPVDDFEDKEKQYPLLKKENLYILDTEALNSNEQSIISEYMAVAGYTSKEYEALQQKLGIVTKSVNEPAGFVIPVEYRLTDDGFTASILTDRIAEQSSDFILQSIDFLEYFACAGEQAKGSFLVPDGDGSLLAFNNKSNGIYEQAFYGQDYSTKAEKLNQLSKNLLFPLFGISEDDGGILAIVEGAAEEGTLCVRPYCDSSPQNHAFVRFNMRKMDATDIGQDSLVPVYNLFSGHRLQTDPVIRYVLLSPGKCDYVGMAHYYRNYLQKKSLLADSTRSESAPVYLDFLCLTSKKRSFLGVPYTEKVALSTLTDIIGVVEKLQNAGFSDLRVRLCGYGDDGLENSVPDRFSLSEKVGTIKELKQLANLLQKDNGRLYLDANFQFVYTDHLLDGFSQKTDTAHYLNRSLVYTGRYDPVMRTYNRKSLPRFFVAPANYPRYARGFLDSLREKCGEMPIGISYGTVGSFLGGDYTSKQDFDRIQSRASLETALGYAVGQTNYLMADNGNAYILPYVQDILNVPSSSGFDIEQSAVPFYSLVVHGTINYAGSPENLTGDKNKAFLRSLEYGANPYLLCITKEDALLSETVYETFLYSLSTEDCLDEFIERWSRAYPELAQNAQAGILSHQQLQKDLYQTTYDNGHGVIVNYGASSATVGGLTVGANDYRFF